MDPDFEELRDLLKELSSSEDVPVNLLIPENFTMDSTERLRSTSSSFLNNQNLLVRSFYKPISRVI